MDVLSNPSKHTYADLLSNAEDARYELIDGELIAFAGASEMHQRIQTNLLTQLNLILKMRGYRVYGAGLDVRLFEKEGDDPTQITTVVQPDILVVCDPRKIGPRGVKGAPDIVVEILSESTSRNDRCRKYHLYQTAGVQEYWIVDPKTQTIQVHRLEDGQYHAGEVFVFNDSLPLEIAPGEQIDRMEVFS